MKNKRKYAILFFVFLGALGFGIFSEKAMAQVSLSLYPTSVRLNLNPGESWSGKVTIINPNNFPLQVNPEKENLGGGAEGAVELLGEKIDYGLASWMKYEEKQISLKPEERRDFSFSINVPQNAQPGGHYAAILFRGLNEGQNQGSGVGISGRVGSVVLVEVSGNIVKKGKIENIIAPKFIGHGPLEIGFKIKNTGNTHFNPEGKIIVSGLFQKKELNWDSRIVFPGYDRTFKASWDKKYFFGPLSVKILLQIPGGGNLTADSIIIWAFPWQETLIILVVLIILILAFRFLKKRFKIVKV